jgi:hypothetical protein
MAQQILAFVVVAILTIGPFAAPRISVAQTLTDGWIRIGMAASGKWFSANLRTLEFIGDPRTIVSFMLFEEGSGGYVPWELHCRDQRVKVNGFFVSIASDANSVRRNGESLTVPYFHERKLTIIGAKSFHGPVQDGKS